MTGLCWEQGSRQMGVIFFLAPYAYGSFNVVLSRWKSKKKKILSAIAAAVDFLVIKKVPKNFTSVTQL